MKPHPWKKSDTEYVETVRKTIKRSRWFLILYGLAFIFFNAMFLYIWNRTLTLEQTTPELFGGAGNGFAIGIQSGAVAGLMIMCAVITIICAIPCINGFRSERLMLKCHDKLKDKEELPTSRVEGTR